MSDEILWTSGFINERLPAPVSPLGWSLVGSFIEELALRDPLRFLGYPDAETIPLTRLWHGHPYVNVQAFQIIYKIFPDFILPEDAYRYFPDGHVALRKRAPYPRWFDLPRFFFSLLRAFYADPFNVSPLNNYRHWAQYTRQHDAGIAKLRARIEAMTHAEPRELFAALRDAENLHRGVLRIHRWSLIDADLVFGLLKRLVGGDAERAARLIADVPNKTLEVDADLRSLPRDQFLAKHGHRSFSLDIAIPTFAEEPGQVERLNALTTDDLQPIARAADGPRSAIGGLSLWQRLLLAPIISLARNYSALREDQRYYWQKSLALSRRLYLMLADRLLADGVIENRNQVFYATRLELQNYFDHKLPKTELTRLIDTRQKEWREYQREFEQSPTESYPAFLRGDIPVRNVRRNVATIQWRGRAVSPGIARGVARIVHSADELTRVQPGEILIAPATDPAWTPVFARIAGLVVERGGVLSHSAVVAREYHIPAVAGISGIVNEIQNGEMLNVDGSRGIVHRVVE